MEDWTKSIETELATGERELPEEPKEEDDMEYDIMRDNQMQDEHL